MGSAKYKITRSSITNQAPGYSTKGYIADTADMLDIQTPAANPATPADALTIATDHTFKASPTGLGWMPCYFLPKSLEHTGDTVGEEGALMQIWSLKGFIPGDSVELQAATQELANRELLILAQDANEGGPVWQYGSKQNPAYISKIQPASATQFDGKKGWAVEITAVGRYKYTGAITEMA